LTRPGGWRVLGTGRAAAWLVACLLVPFLLAPSAARAQDEPRFEVRSASVAPEGGVWNFSARLDLGLSESATEALQQGVPVTLEIEVLVTTSRRFLPDADVAELSHRWRLEYHALAERYLVTNENSGEQAAYPTLAAALTALAQPSRVPILDMALVEPGRRYEISTRASIAIGGVPTTVKVLMFWREWTRYTGWYTWTVRG
jgi:hypothetical protein